MHHIQHPHPTHSGVDMTEGNITGHLIRFALPLLAGYIRRTKTPLLSGTTGFTDPDFAVLQELSTLVRVIWTANYSTGIAVLKRMVRENDLAVLLSLHELELAERISDTVVCVAGDRIDRIGPPEEIFTRAYIAKLYQMEHGKYDPCFDSLEFVP